MNRAQNSTKAIKVKNFCRHQRRKLKNPHQQLKGIVSNHPSLLPQLLQAAIVLQSSGQILKAQINLHQENLISETAENEYPTK